MALLIPLSYLTLEEFKANTRDCDLNTMQSAQFNPLAAWAEDVIDGIVGEFSPLADDQDRKFPDEVLGVIPVEVKKAMVELVTYGARNSTIDDLKGKKSGERWSGSGYGNNYDTGAANKTQSQTVEVPPIVKKLLRKWGGNTYPLTY